MASFSIKRDAPYKQHSTGIEQREGPIAWKVIKRTDNLLVIDMMNADPAIANALRRIMISEVPTVAVNRIGLMMNSSIIQDEVLCHRIGMVPFNIDPEMLLEDEVINFDLDVMGKHETVDLSDLKGKSLNNLDQIKEYRSSTRVFSGDFKWMPANDQQKERFKGRDPAPLEDDILVARLLPGQSIFLRAQCTPGIGKDHAKWSPVATATYRNLPQIDIINQKRADAIGETLVKACPQGVFDIEDSHVVVKKPRKCTMCRECIRRDDWDEVVALARKGDHFIFTVESVGTLTSEEIFLRAIRILREKANSLLEERKQAKKLEEEEEEEGDEEEDNKQQQDAMEQDDE